MHGRAERLIFLFWNVSNSRAGRYIGGLIFVRNRGEDALLLQQPAKVFGKDDPAPGWL